MIVIFQNGGFGRRRNLGASRLHVRQLHNGFDQMLRRMNRPLTQSDIERRQVEEVPNRRIGLRQGDVFGLLRDERMGHEQGQGQAPHAQDPHHHRFRGSKPGAMMQHEGIVEDACRTCPA